MTPQANPDDLTLPKMREDIQLLPGPQAASGAPSWAIFDPVRHKYFRISWDAFQLLTRWQSGTARRLVERVHEETTCPAELDDVKQLIQFLHANNLTLGPSSDGASTENYTAQYNATRAGWLKWLFQNYLFLRIPLVRPDAFFQKISRYLDPLFSTVLRNIILSLGVLGIFLISRQWDSFTTTFLYFFSTEGIVYFILGLVFVKICHELGHALTATRFGCRVASMGVAFLIFFPVLYTDTTDVYRLTSRRKRLYVSAAGILTEFYLALICLFLWTLLPDGIPRSVVFVLGTISITLTILINLNPFLRFDGYYFLADALGMENLQNRAFTLGRWQLRKIVLGSTEPPPERHTARLQKFLVIYAWSTWLYRFFLMVAIASVVYYFFFKLLGVILFTGVIYTFILLPVMKEFTIWKTQSMHIGTKRAAVLMSFGVAFLILALLPWRSSISVPAIVEPAARATIFAPAPGKITEVLVAAGDKVHAGQVLLTLESPQIEEELRVTEISNKVFNLRLQRIAASTDELEDSQVIQQLLEENQSKMGALRALKDQLVLRSSLNGTIVELGDSLHVGRYINETLPIAYVVDPSHLVMRGVVGESNLTRISPSQPARFVPDQLTEASLEATITSISQANTTSLDQPYLASIYGGGVAVRENAQGDLIPEDSVYRLVLELEGNHAPPGSVIRGVALVEGEPKSFARRAFDIIAAALVRGSAF